MKVKRVGRLLAASALSLAIGMSLVGCGGSSEDSTAEATADVAAFSKDAGATYDYAAEEETEDTIEEVAEEEVSEETSASGGSDENSSSETSDGTIYEEKLVYTCNIEMETTAYSDTVERIRNLIAEYEGTVESEYESDSDYDWYSTENDSSSATMSMSWTIRIPTEKYEEFIDSLEGDNGKILTKSVNVDNISTSYYDTQTTIESLEKQEDRLLEMMDEAETIEDMISVETRLSEVQTQLSQYQTDMNRMNTNVAYSTIYLYVNEVATYSPSVTEASFGERIVEAFKNGTEDFVEGIKSFVLIVVEVWPLWIILAVVVLVTVGIIRHVGKKKKEEKME